MMVFILRRLLASIPVVVGITVVAFLLIHLTPGDPAKVILFGSNAGPVQIEQLRHELGLDQPLFLQYGKFIWELLHGNLGTSYLTQNSVAHELFSRAPSTLILTGAAMVVAIMIGIPLGMVAGRWPNSLADRTARAISFLGVAIPYFFVALILVLVLSIHLNWLPAIDDGTPKALFIPAFSLGWGYAAILTRLIRGGVIEELQSEYVKSARARGVGEWRLLFGHVLRNTCTPVITLIGLQFGNILTGAAITEVIFGRAGIGSFLATAIIGKNIPVVQGAVVVIGFGYVLINLIVDLLIGAIDPRTRLAIAA